MKTYINFKIWKIETTQGYDSDTQQTVPQVTAYCQIPYTNDKNDSNYPYARLSGGSELKITTINPEVYKNWEVGKALMNEITGD
jgi:hypothetical protein